MLLMEWCDTFKETHWCPVEEYERIIKSFSSDTSGAGGKINQEFKTRLSSEVSALEL